MAFPFSPIVLLFKYTLVWRSVPSPVGKSCIELLVLAQPAPAVAGRMAARRSAVPEGPSLVILKEATARFVGQTIVEAGGNVRAIDPARLVGQPIVSLRTWGKHFLIELPTMVVRIHFLLFGTYRVDERRDKPPRLFLRMADGGEINFYACAIREIDADLDAQYDWSADVMSDCWDPKRARKKLRAHPRPSGIKSRRAAGAQAARPGRRSPSIQFRFPGVEKGVRAQAALAGPCEDHLPALPHPFQKSPPRSQQPAQLLLRALPEAL